MLRCLDVSFRCGINSTTAMRFNELLKELRIKHQKTLRECAGDLGVDPSNWSKMERGVNPGPKDITVLNHWAKYFGLQGEDEVNFYDAATLSRKEIPDDIASDERIMAALPAFFRSLRESDMSDEKLQQFVDDLRKLHSRDPKA
jgi:transcriptional regulator with XRE-family HTH domain